MAPHTTLSSSDISEKARRDLLQLLEGVRGKKHLVFERSLAGALNLLVKFSTLQEYGVDKPFFLENDNVDSSQRNVVFLARGEKAKTVTAVADQIKRLRRNGQVEHEFWIIWTPRRTLVSDHILEEAGVLGEASVLEYPLFFVPLAEDVLSLELDDAFSDLYLLKDPTSIFLMAKALMLLQRRHGLFPRIVGKGDNAWRLTDLLLRMRSELNAGSDSRATSSFLGLTPSTSIESLIIVDRQVDFLTVLLTQLTYEGLIDETFGIEANQTEIDSSVLGGMPPAAGQAAQQQNNTTAPPSAMKRKIPLDPKDPIYSSLMDANFATISSLMNQAARRLQSSYDSKQIASKTTSELRDIVAKLPGYQAEKAGLALHTSLAEEILKHTRSELFSRMLEVEQNLAAGADPSTQRDSIDELLARALPLPTVLRLLAIESVTNNGIRARDLDAIRRSLVYAHGPQHLRTLAALDRIGLVTLRTSLGVGIPNMSALTLSNTTSSSSASSNPHATSSTSSSAHHLLRPSSTTSYSTTRKSLRLIVDEVNESTPDDIAYVFSGYAPLSVRLVQCVIQKAYLAGLTATDKKSAAAAATGVGVVSAMTGWRPFEDVLKNVGGVTVDETQTASSPSGGGEFAEKAVRARQILNGSGSAPGTAGVSGAGGHADDGKIVLVCFLGGVCRAEVAALRFIARKLAEAGNPRRIVICTTGVVSGDRVVGAAIEKESFKLGKGAATSSSKADETGNSSATT